MWETLERARRRLLRDGPPSDPDRAAPPDAGAHDPGPLTFALGRTELEHLVGALTDPAAVDEGRPDTPGRLEAALSRAIDTAAGRGRPTVTRRPAGLYTPEMWHIEIAGADDRTRAALELAIRGGGTV